MNNFVLERVVELLKVQGDQTAIMITQETANKSFLKSKGSA